MRQNTQHPKLKRKKGLLQFVEVLVSNLLAPRQGGVADRYQRGQTACGGQQVTKQQGTATAFSMTYILIQAT